MLVYLVLSFADIYSRGALPFLLDGSFESIAFLIEIGFGVILPLCIVFSPLANYWCALVAYGILTSSGVMLNRMNVVITGMWRETGSIYYPAVTEVLFSLGLVTGGILVYMLLCENFNILEHEAHEG
jgi:Ni/Fe-hydrogenase subunit HybB-like protein